VRQAAPAQHTDADGRLGPQVGDIEDHRATLDPAQPDARETEKERRALHDQVIGPIEQEHPEETRGEHE